MLSCVTVAMMGGIRAQRQEISVSKIGQWFHSSQGTLNSVRVTLECHGLDCGILASGQKSGMLLKSLPVDK
jgi:hypothetical protein